jgi:hypothetical protein
MSYQADMRARRAAGLVAAIAAGAWAPPETRPCHPHRR